MFPLELQQLVERCLQKEARQRYQDLADVKKTLEELNRRLSTGQLALSPVVGKSSSTLARRWLWVGAAGGLLATAMAVWFLERRGPPPQPLQLKQLTFDAGLALHPAISADGKYIAYASDRGGGGDMHIWVQELPAGEPERLTKDEANEDYPAFSPDGTKIAFHSDRGEGGIYVVPLLGGQPRLLEPRGTRPQYSPDGWHLLFTQRAGHGWTVSSQEFLIPAEGGERRQVQMPIELGLVNWHHLSMPVFSLDGNQLLCLAQLPAKTGSVSTSWYIVPLAGGSIIRVEPPAHGAVPNVTYSTNLGTPVPLAWLRGNRILYWASSGDAVTLWLARLSALRIPRWLRQVIGPLIKSDQLTFGADVITSASVSDNGTVVFASSPALSRLWSVPLGRGKGGSEGDLASLPPSGKFDYFPSLSDNGKLAYVSQESGKWNVWLRELSSGKNPTWLANTNGNALNVSTLINRDGSRVAYTTCPDRPRPPQSSPPPRLVQHLYCVSQRWSI
jgi:dipeptidyl aminopeptidase/acylaminoacyl peptidase